MLLQCLCIYNRNSFLFAAVLGASGSNELAKNLNGATALQNTPSKSIENETITWNWNPQASPELKYEPKCGRSDNNSGHVSHMPHNCYGQKRNTNGTDEASGSSSSNAKNLSIWSHENHDGNDVFWSKILFNNNSNSTGTSSNRERCRPNNSIPSTSNTAVISNSIISNFKDHHPKSTDLSDMDGIDRNFNMSHSGDRNGAPNKLTHSAGAAAASTTVGVASIFSIDSSSDSSYHSKSKNLSQKHKTVKNQADHKSDTNHYEKSNFEVTDGGVIQLSLDNDLNAANSTFLRALNDLHLDYNDLTGATNDMKNRQEHEERTAKSKERLVREIIVNDGRKSDGWTRAVFLLLHKNR